MLEAYIPTEVVTCYVAVSAAIDNSHTRSFAGQWIAFSLFIAITPVAHWCEYARLLRQRRQNLPWRPSTWPWYGLVSGTVAFAIWGFALPDSPFKSLSWYQGTVAAAVLLVGSLLLGMAASVFGPQKTSLRTTKTAMGTD